MVKKAIELALDLGGNQTLAVKEIEKMKKGLSKNSAVASALRTANEEMTGTSSVAMPDGIPLGKVKKRKELEEGDLRKLDTVKRYKPVDFKHVGDKNLDPKMGIFTVNFEIKTKDGIAKNINKNF